MGVRRSSLIPTRDWKSRQGCRGWPGPTSLSPLRRVASSSSNPAVYDFKRRVRKGAHQSNAKSRHVHTPPFPHIHPPPSCPPPSPIPPFSRSSLSLPFPFPPLSRCVRVSRSGVLEVIPSKAETEGGWGGMQSKSKGTGGSALREAPSLARPRRHF